VSTIREQILADAIKLTTGDRNKDYGDPRPNFDQTAALFTQYLNFHVSAVDVAVLMILVKVARLSESPGKLDNWTDIAGYAACGAEVSQPPIPWEPAKPETV